MRTLPNGWVEYGPGSKVLCPAPPKERRQSDGALREDRRQLADRRAAPLQFCHRFLKEVGADIAIRVRVHPNYCDANHRPKPSAGTSSEPCRECGRMLEFMQLPAATVA